MSRLRASITGRDSPRSSRAVATAIALGAGALFWLPSLEAGRGWFPAPLDDVYIHFDFARSLGQGHPFEWIAGQGYSSGETSPLYAVVLAIGWVVGFRGRLLGIWAAIVAVLAVASLLESLRRLLAPSPTWLAWLVALLPLSIGVVDWALFSGMEVAVFVAAIGRALESLAQLRSRHDRGGPTREGREWRLGAWGACLVLLRPEAVVVVAVLALAAARGAGRRSALASLGRAAIPGAAATAFVLGMNLLATGDARSAGAQLKLLSSNPYMSDVDRARVFVENLVTFWVKIVRSELAVVPALAVALPLLALVGALAPQRRTLAGTSILSALAWTLLVSWNGNAPHHNFRYYAPALVLLAIAAAFGVAALAGLGRGPRAALAGVLALGALAVGAPKIAGQVRHFRAASANIRDQHIEVGERVARLPADARVLLGDAGAIPYVSNRSAVDALGLGGYRRVPFAHAAVHGEAATIELIERLPAGERPTHFALYPNWFGALTSRFGIEIDRVTITNNVICGSPTKAIYRAEWTALDTPRSPRPDDLLDEVDIADVIDEGAHAYHAPLPHGGWTTLDVLADETGARRFDGGRTIPHGASESFRLVTGSAASAVTLRVRIDADARGIVVRTGTSERELALEPPEPGRWRSGTVTLEEGIAAGQSVTLTAREGAYRSYHVWVERPAAASR